MVQTLPEESPFSTQSFVFRGRGDLTKLFWWNGDECQVGVFFKKTAKRHEGLFEILGHPSL